VEREQSQRVEAPVSPYTSVSRLPFLERLNCYSAVVSFEVRE